jgi:WD40 repeat protein/predicted Ser/Thr protein kinase
MVHDPTIPDQSTDAAERCRRFESVLGAYFEALDAGQSPDRQELIDRHPDLADDLAEFFAAQHRFNSLASPLRVVARAAQGRLLTACQGPDRTEPDSPDHVDSANATVDDATVDDEPRPHDQPRRTPGATTDSELTTQFSQGEDDELANGTRIRYIGDYEIKRELGRGGMGVVYLAKQLSLNRLVALKMIRAGLWAEAAEVRRFKNEAEAIANLDHPGIVSIYEVGQFQGRQYFSMQLVEGPSLDKVLDGFRAWPRKAAWLVAEIAQAVHHAHQRGILHRDLKPSNILLDPQGKPRITDFGLAKRLEADSSLSVSGSILGTPSYMSPEQASAQRGMITTATDVYGLGALLYAVLTGRPPFQGDSVMDTLQQVREQSPEPPRKVDSHVNRDLETICLKCLDKDPKRRYGSADAVADDLDRFLHGDPILARRTNVPERVAKWARRKPAIAALVGLLLLVATTGLAGVVWQWGEARTQRDQAVTARNIADDERREAQRRSTRLALDRGLGLCEQGHADHGLLWLARGLQLAPPSAGDLQRLLRLSLDGWRNQVHPLRAILEHQAQVLAVAFRPDGRAMLTGGYDYAARLWDADGKPLGDPWQHQSAVGSIIFGPDGKTVLTLSYAGVAQLWDVATGKPSGEPLAHKPFVRLAAWSPDGRTLLTGGSDGSVWLWDAATRAPVLRALQAHGKPLTHEGDLRAAAFSPDGKSFLTGSYDHTARLWETATGRAIGEPMQHQDQVIAVAFSPDGKTALTASFDHTARLWDAGSGKPRMEPLRHPYMVYAATFSPDGKTVLTGGGERVGRLWDATTGAPVGPPLPHHGGVSLVGFSPDGRLALTGSSDNTARLWDVATGQPQGAPLQHQGFLQSAAFRTDGKLVLTGSYDRSARLWEVAAGPRATMLRNEGRATVRTMGFEPTTSTRADELRHAGLLTVAIFSPDSRSVLTGDWEGTARLWHVASGEQIGKPLRHSDPIAAAAFSRDGKTVVIGTGKHEFQNGGEVLRRGEARLWNVSDGTPSSFTLAHKDLIRSLSFNPDGRTILTGSDDRTARLWDAATGRPLSPPLKHERVVHTVAFSPHGRVAITADQNETMRWDVATGKRLDPPLRYEGNGPAMDLAFRHDAQAVLVGFDDHTARIYGTSSGKPLCPPLRHQGMVAAVAFSPDGKLALTGSQDATARIWDVATGRPVGEPLRHQGQVLDVAFSPDGKTVLTASYDDVVQLWDVATGRPIGPPWMHPIFGRFVTFSPDGQYALTLTGGDEGRNIARLWKAPFPLEGDAVRIGLWVQTLTGMELDSDDGVRALDAAAWQGRRRELEQLGGPPSSFDGRKGAQGHGLR